MSKNDDKYNLEQGVANILRVALAGNPNCGKTTLFNELTGARQHVGNYAGVTVETKDGNCRYNGTIIKVTDLPGTYSLTAYSPEELVARNFLVHDQPDVVIDILDASNIERNLYLAVQIRELGVPTVLALNMVDVATQRGIEFNIDLLAKLIGAPIIPTVAHKGTGKNDLLAAAVKLSNSQEPVVPLQINYGPVLEEEICGLACCIERCGKKLGYAPARWLAIKLLEGDQQVKEKLSNPELIDCAEKAAKRVESVLGDTPEALIADQRYGFISGACQEAVRSTVESRHTVSDTIDTIVTNRVFGLPIFFGLMYIVFNLTFKLGNPPMDWIEGGFAWLGNFISKLWPAGSDSLLRSLLVDGIIGGVGGVLVFLPNILLLFLAIAILEDSGYMARAAFLMDRLMHRIGLHGKSFVPMLIGFGCTVPAIMATRTLENRRDRLTTMLVLPLMSCGARLPIYALIIPAFFPEKWQAPLLWLIYSIGIILAILAAKLLKMTILKGETPPFVMELPPYRLPTVKSVSLHMWNRGGEYLKKAGTIILGISILLWAMQQWPKLTEERKAEFEQQREAVAAISTLNAEEQAEQVMRIDHAEAEAELETSLMGRVGQKVAVVLKPCGFDWKISTALIGAFAAKEVFVSQLGIVYALGAEQTEESGTLRDKLRANYTPLVGFCIILFCLISTPCMATIAVTRRESESWGWALFQLFGLTIMAWVITFAVYQIGSLFV